MNLNGGDQVNVELVEARIREINDAVQMLRSLIAKDFGELTVYEKFSIRYLVIQLVEAASSICIHILISSFGERTEGFPECFTRLSMKGVISKDLAAKLSSAARLRNLLVHRYWEIADERVYRSVEKGVGDFEEYVAKVRKYISKSSNPKALNYVNLKLRYHELPVEERVKLLNLLRERLEPKDDIVFAYVHGGLVERKMFRDVDVAVWIRNPEMSFYYTVDFSARLEVELGHPVDLHVLNEAPLPFKYRVFTRGKLLFSRDEGLRAAVVDKTIREYIDLIKLTETSINCALKEIK